jgi:hypothetical protein
VVAVLAQLPDRVGAALLGHLGEQFEVHDTARSGRRARILERVSERLSV